MKGTGERQRCFITPSVTLRRSAGSPTDSAKRIAVRRMCLGSHGCGSPTVRSRLRRLVMRRISSTTGVFYNSRAADARRGKVRGRGRSPALVIRTKGLYLLPAYDQQVEEGQHRRQGRSYVRKGRRGQDPPGASGLRARQYPVARQEPVGAGGSVDLDGQRHYVEE